MKEGSITIEKDFETLIRLARQDVAQAETELLIIERGKNYPPETARTVAKQIAASLRTIADHIEEAAEED